MVKGDGPKQKEESVIMKDDNMWAVYWVQQCNGRNDALPAGGLLRLMGRREVGVGSALKYSM